MLKKLLIIATALLIQFSQPLIADLWEPALLEGFHLFNDEEGGPFQGNLVADFSDNSSWKVHPKDTGIAAAWQPGETVYIRPRTSFYWFKREHKFEIYNHNRRESVRAMLAYHQDRPHEILEASDVFASRGVERPLYGTDKNGESAIVGFFALETDYRRVLMLDDGSFWEIMDHVESFVPGATIYIGFNDSKEVDLPILITGKGTAAVWATLYPLERE